MDFKNYVKIPGSERKPMKGATKTAAADPNEVMQATIVLRPRQSSANAEPLEALVARGGRLTREEYQARYGADPADVQTVLKFASSFGLALTKVDMGARTLTLTGKTSNFSKAFQVELAKYEHSGGSYRGRTGYHQYSAGVERHHSLGARTR